MKSSFRLLVVIAVVVVGVGVAGGMAWLRASRSLGDGLIQANGRIESDTVNVAGKLAGRIVTLAAREGDTVKAGAELVRLDDRSVQAQLAEAQSALAPSARRSRAATRCWRSPPCSSSNRGSTPSPNC
jgi:HlyD family secretion protein